LTGIIGAAVLPEAAAKRDQRRALACSTGACPASRSPATERIAQALIWLNESRAALTSAAASHTLARLHVMNAGDRLPTRPSSGL
jgi:hypothetical protein